MATPSVTITGFKELEAELAKLTRATGKNAVKRALMQAGQPMANVMRALAPDDPRTTGDDLEQSIGVSDKLSARQAGLHKRMFQDDRAAVEVFIGAGPLAQASLQEFGTINHGPQPFARPAFDQEAKPTIERVGGLMWAEIQKSVARAARRAAKTTGG